MTINPLDLQAKKMDKNPQTGYYREMLESIYNLCLELNKIPVKKTMSMKMSIEQGINCLEKHGIGIQEILKNEYKEG